MREDATSGAVRGLYGDHCDEDDDGEDDDDLMI